MHCTTEKKMRKGEDKKIQSEKGERKDKHYEGEGG